MRGFCLCIARTITHAKAQDANKHDILMGVYTINNESDFRKIMKYPVPALVTNFPKRIKEYVQQST